MIAQLTRRALDDVVVVPMRRRHLRSVLAIERRAYPRPWSPALFAAELERRDTRRYIVALAPRRGAGAFGQLRPGREVVGYAGLILEPSAGEGGGESRRRGAGILGEGGGESRRRGAGILGEGGVRPREALLFGGEAHVTTVAVEPRHHRRKVATHLLLALLAEARRAGADAATLEVRVANRGAQRLYAGFGFVPVGVRPGYYAETGEDALIMWAHDLQGEEMAGRLAAQAARIAAPGGASGAPDLHVPWVQGREGLGGPWRGDDTMG